MPGWSPRMGVTTMGASLHRGVGGCARLGVGGLCAVWVANQAPTRIIVHATPAESWMQAIPVATSVAASAYRARVVGADLIDRSVALIRCSDHGPKGAFMPRHSSIGLPPIDARPSVTAPLADREVPFGHCDPFTITVGATTMPDMNSASQLRNCASDVVDAARRFEAAAQTPDSYPGAPDSLAALEEAFQLLSAAWYRLAADATASRRWHLAGTRSARLGNASRRRGGVCPHRPYVSEWPVEGCADHRAPRSPPPERSSSTAMTRAGG